jgi:RNA polymerase sigma factor (sigma-70 family)
VSNPLPINLSDDRFVRTIIYRKVTQAIESAGLDLSEREDLVQEVYARATQSLALFDPEVGHLYPYVCTVVQRSLSKMVRDRTVAKRGPRRVASLSKLVNQQDGSQTELNQLIGMKDSDRRLGRERRLSDEQLNSLRLDLAEMISKLPPTLREFLERRKTQSVSDIARDMNIARTTLNDWMLEIRNQFEAAGIGAYLES